VWAGPTSGRSAPLGRCVLPAEAHRMFGGSFQRGNQNNRHAQEPQRRSGSEALVTASLAMKSWRSQSYWLIRFFIFPAGSRAETRS